MVHLITIRVRPRTRKDRGADTYTYTHAGTGIAVAHRTDGLSRLCRKLVALGVTGPAEARGEDGRLRYTVAAIERLGKWTLVESDRDQLRWRPHVPLPMTIKAAARDAGAHATGAGHAVSLRQAAVMESA